MEDICQYMLQTPESSYPLAQNFPLGICPQRNNQNLIVSKMLMLTYLQKAKKEIQFIAIGKIVKIHILLYMH